jgi:hypothetical protein
VSIRCRPVSVALLGLLLWTTACTSYSAIGVREVADHGKVRVTTIDGERQTLHDPSVEADSIKSRDARAIPLDQVSTLENVSINVVGTIFTVIGVALLVQTAVAVIDCASDSQQPCWDMN